MVQKLAHNQLIHSPAFGRWLRSYDVCVAVISDGTVYRDGFDSDLIDILETARLTETPLCIYWGNLETGEIWDGLPGYVGRSAGLKKVPLCVKTKRSRGGRGDNARNFKDYHHKRGTCSIHARQPH